uniref:Snake toxin/toxin-like domain-containing protein n=1 Tax=Propithecus coquereli TaxID=379532 RepID=A0A2K6ESY1_PROCO
MALLALLLVAGLPLVQAETNKTATQEAARLRCHVCEQENDFTCKNSQKCGEDEKFCAIITVSEYLHSCWG